MQKDRGGGGDNPHPKVPNSHCKLQTLDSKGWQNATKKDVLYVSQVSKYWLNGKKKKKNSTHQVIKKPENEGLVMGDEEKEKIVLVYIISPQWILYHTIW